MTHLRQRSRDPYKMSPTEAKRFRRRLTSRVKMTARGLSILVFVTALAVVVHGYDPRGKFPGSVPTLEDCMKPPMGKFGHECCRLPKERIWGDLRGSLSLCMRRFKDESKNDGPSHLARQETEMAAPEGSEMDSSAEGTSESASTPSTSPRATTAGYPKRRRRPYWKKPLSERVRDLFSSLYEQIENTVNALWQSVVIITDHLRQHINDSCFMECVFEDQGFLVNKVLNKEALMTRLSLTLGRNEAWNVAARAALETCYAGLQVPSNSTCHSGSEEIFRCIFKQLFFNCPNWLQNDYCTSLREFYKKCPNGPPPETTDDVDTTASPEEDAASVATTTESDASPDE